MADFLIKNVIYKNINSLLMIYHYLLKINSMSQAHNQRKCPGEEKPACNITSRGQNPFLTI